MGDDQTWTTSKSCPFNRDNGQGRRFLILEAQSRFTRGTRHFCTPATVTHRSAALVQRNRSSEEVLDYVAQRQSLLPKTSPRPRDFTSSAIIIIKIPAGSITRRNARNCSVFAASCRTIIKNSPLELATYTAVTFAYVCQWFLRVQPPKLSHQNVHRVNIWLFCIPLVSPLSSSTFQCSRGSRLATSFLIFLVNGT